MCAHNLCYEQKYERHSTEQFPFLQLEKSLYIAWACFRNDYDLRCIKIKSFVGLSKNTYRNCGI